MNAFNAGCYCCQAGGDPSQHCPSCHSVAMHGLTDFAYVSVAMGLPVYWGTDQARAVDAARVGAGYVLAMPILVDYRHLSEDRSFRPVLSTPFGDTPVPLDAVRSQRNADGAGHPATWPGFIDRRSGAHEQGSHEQNARAGHTDSDRPVLPGAERPPAEWPFREPMTTADALLAAQLARAVQNGPESTESAQHAERVPEPQVRPWLP